MYKNINFVFNVKKSTRRFTMIVKTVSKRKTKIGLHLQADEVH